MKFAIAALYFVILLPSSAKAQKSRIYKTGFPAITDKGLVLVFNANEEGFPGPAVEPIGILYSKDFEQGGKCTFSQILDILKQHARSNGANLIKIVEHKGPGFNTTCERLTVLIYRVDSVDKFEKHIVWDKERKLSWADFKGKPKPYSNNNVPAQGICGFPFQSQRIVTTSKYRAFTPAIFDCTLSWVLPDSIGSPGALQFQQVCFNLCEVYARHCRRRILEAGLNEFRNNAQALTIYTEVYKHYTEMLEQCTEETKYGRDPIKLAEWQKQVAEQLTDLEKYSEL